MGAPVGIAVAASSGSVANAPAVATLPAAPNRFTHLAGFDITVGGATAGALVNATVTGIVGGTATYVIAVPTGATLGASLVLAFDPPLQGAAQNTAIVVTLPAVGAGSTAACVNARGVIL